MPKHRVSQTGRNIPQLLTHQFWNDYLEMLKQYNHPEKIEITEHLILLFQVASGYNSTGNEKFTTDIIQVRMVKRATLYRATCT